MGFLYSNLMIGKENSGISFVLIFSSLTYEPQALSKALSTLSKTLLLAIDCSDLLLRVTFSALHTQEYDEDMTKILFCL